VRGSKIIFAWKAVVDASPIRPHVCHLEVVTVHQDGLFVLASTIMEDLLAIHVRQATPTGRMVVSRLRAIVPTANTVNAITPQRAASVMNTTQEKLAMNVLMDGVALIAQNQ